MDSFREKIYEWLRFIEAYPYVVLRNWTLVGDEGLNEVDVIVANKEEFLGKVGLATVAASAFHFKVKLGTRNFYLNIYSTYEGYFPHDLAEQVLKGRNKHVDLGIYVINAYDAFWSNLYHYTYHGTEYSSEQRMVMSSLMPKDFNGKIDDHAYAHEWLCKHNILPVKCADPSIGYIIP